jgi:O-antigen biosynthesis protein
MPYTLDLQQRGIEVIYGPQKFENFLACRGKDFDIIILTRPYISVKYIDTIQKHAPISKIIYDIVDLHY